LKVLSCHDSFKNIDLPFEDFSVNRDFWRKFKVGPFLTGKIRGPFFVAFLRFKLVQLARKNAEFDVGTLVEFMSINLAWVELKLKWN